MLIWGVVIGHMITVLKCGSDTTVWLHTFLRTYDMPMFAFICGYFLRKSIYKHSWKNVMLRKIETILYPTVLWNVILNVLTRNMSIYLWYLWSIFFCSIIVCSIVNISDKKWVRNLLFVVVILVTHCGVGSAVNLGFLLFPCIVGFYYNSIEFFLQQHTNSIQRRGIGIMCCIVFIIMQLFWRTEYSVWSVGTDITAGFRIFFLVVYRGAIGIVGCFVIMHVYNLILRIKKTYIIDIICTWGKSTLEIYILQSLFVEIIGGKIIGLIVNRIGVNPFILSGSFLGFVIAPIFAFIAVLAMNELQLLLKKIPCIGRWFFRLDLKET
jgi:fucose 4-O-acetylase-like acetyltransferase